MRIVHIVLLDDYRAKDTVGMLREFTVVLRASLRNVIIYLAKNFRYFLGRDAITASKQRVINTKRSKTNNKLPGMVTGWWKPTTDRRVQRPNNYAGHIGDRFLFRISTNYHSV